MAERKSSLIILPDPEPTEAEKIWKKLGGAKALDGMYLHGNRVLVAKWIRDKVSKSLYAAHDTQREDSYQGKTGLVLMVGPAAFKDDPANGAFFHGDTVKVGDWVSYRASDGIDQDFVPTSAMAEKVPCRVLKDVQIVSRVPRPNFFY